MAFIGHFVLVGMIFLVLDAVWLSVVANSFYKTRLSSLLRDKPDFVPAVIFYVLYVAGMVMFALNPALGKESLTYAVSHAALLGLLMYGTYDLTNQSTLKNWPWSVTLVDLLWGTTATAIAVVSAYLILI